jgi:hypothetical protein
MKKIRWYCQLIFTINSVSFVILNANSNFVKLNGIHVLWGWTVWFYMILNIILLANSFMKDLNLTISRLTNYLLQVILVWLYVFAFCLKLVVFSKTKLIIVLVLLMIGILILNGQELEKDNQVHITRRLFSDQDIERYMKSILTHSKQEKGNIYVGVVICNILSFLMIVLLPLLMDITQNIIGKNEITTTIFMFLIAIYVVISYFKYKTMHVHLFVFLTESILSIIGVLLYIMSLDTVLQGIPIIIISVYFLFPYIVRCYWISQFYHVGNDK